MTSPENTIRALQLFQQAQQLHAARQLAPAADAFRKALALLPDHPSIIVAYAALAEEVQDWNAAEKLYRRLGALRPASNFEGKLALCLFRLERYEDALPLMRTHFARHPDDRDVLLPFGLTLAKLKRWQEALDTGRKLDAVRPDEQSMSLMLNSLFNLGGKDELDALVETAITRYPQSPLVLSLCGAHLLKRGDFKRGFGFLRAMRWRYESAKPDYATVRADAWDGKRFDGLLLVDGEQGLGEEILAASMFGELVRLGQSALIACERRLLPLFRRSFPTLEFVARGDGDFERIIASGAKYRRIQSLDLGVFFRRGDTFPVQRPWLIADAVRGAGLRERYRRDNPGKLLAGISWKSRRDFVFGPDKSVALADLAPLLSLPSHAWFNIQYGDIAADLDDVAARGIAPPAADPAIDPTVDLDGLAAQLLALDVVVSTSNTTAHLAGALGAPCHLLLPKTRPVLWYWGYDTPTTPWYPSIRIHRNTREDDWQEFAAGVARTLERPA